MLSHHFFGIGVGESAFSAIYPSYAVSGTERVMHSHRLDLQILSEFGVFGGLIFLLFFILLCLRATHTLAHAKHIARVSVLCASCALFGALVMGAFDYIWYHFGNFTLFFMLAAWVALPCSKKGDVD